MAERMIRAFVARHLGFRGLALAAVTCSTAAWGEGGSGAPAALPGVGITEKIGQRAPLDLRFVDSEGKTVELAEYFDRGRPVILTLNYSDCPMLCNLQLIGLVDALRTLKWTVGREMDIVTVSVDPKETVERSRKTKDRYLGHYGRPEAREGWSFLTGREEDIRALADAVGFGYAYHEPSREYVHVAAVILLSPRGTVERYVYGAPVDAGTLRFALMESSDGQLGGPIDRALAAVFRYDSAERRYRATGGRIAVFAGVGLTFAMALAWAVVRLRSSPRFAGL